MTALRRADDHVITVHAMNISRMKKLADRRKAISMFQENYGTPATEKLKAEIKRLWPTMREAKRK